MTDTAAMIDAQQVCKTFQGYEPYAKGAGTGHRVSGIALWLRNIGRLTGNKASTTVALSDVSLKVQRGEILGIFGENGAGKTTLIKILSGLLVADSGTMAINGSPILRDIKSAISFVSTNGWMGLEWQLTVLENLLLYGNLYGLSGQRLRRRAIDALTQVGLTDNMDKRVSELSAGMRQKATIARGLILDRPVLYLDEPTVSLDVNTSRDLRQMLATYARERGKTIIIASHFPPDLAICDRILLLHRGRVVGLGAWETLLAPLPGASALHISHARVDAETRSGIHNALTDLPTVIRVRVEESIDGNSNGSHGTRQAMRVILSHDHIAHGAIIDAFIDHNTPILSMRPGPMTLLEVYEHHVEAQS